MIRTNLSTVFCLSLLGSLASTAVAQQPPEPPMTPSQMKMADEIFIKTAYSGNMLHALASKYALEQVQNPKVRELAELLIKDHEAANKMLEPVAKAAGVAVPTELLPPHRAMLNAAMGVKGEPFATTFLFNMASLHVHDILDTAHAANHSATPAVKDFAAAALPTLRAYYAMIKPMAEAKAGLADGLSGTK